MDFGMIFWKRNCQGQRRRQENIRAITRANDSKSDRRVPHLSFGISALDNPKIG